MEIERKFLLKKLPDNLSAYPYYDMEQMYISTNPLIRARKRIKYEADKAVACNYILTIKSKGLLAHEEYELEIDLEGYNNLLAKAEGNVITKRRYLIPLDKELTLELDIFSGAFDGLIVGEIEFPSEEAAKKYTPPDYISEEVTYNRKFSNSFMSQMSLAEISDFISMLHVD